MPAQVQEVKDLAVAVPGLMEAEQSRHDLTDVNRSARCRFRSVTARNLRCQVGRNGWQKSSMPQ
jgi:hypothetical protein